MEGSLTLDQKFAVSELRRIMKDELPQKIYDDTILLLKFLKARDFSLKQAESMLRKNLRWRRETQVETILRDFKPSELISKYFPMSFIGFDYDGYPVMYVDCGTADFKGIFKSTNYAQFSKNMLHIIETNLTRLDSQTKKYGRSIASSNGIFNVANLEMSQIAVKQNVTYAIRIMIMFQDNYPEFIRKIRVINASVYFTFIWPVIKKCLAPGVLEKFKIFGQDGWKEELLGMMDADILPAFLGGNKTDSNGDPMCSSYINHGGPVPESYILSKNINKFAGKSGVKLAKIERQGSASVTVNVTNPNSILHWEYEVKNHDIGFGLLLHKDDDTMEELIPTHKIRTELEPHSGLYRCEKPGKYIIVFDNTYSWYHLKEVWYRTWVTEANESE